MAKQKMKSLIFILILKSCFLFAQSNDIIYLQETENFYYPRICILTGFNAKIKLTFDVQNLKPTNVKVETIEPYKLDYIEKATISNLDSITFVNDVKNFSILFEYVVDENISNDYIEYVSQGHIKVFKARPYTAINEYIAYSVNCDESTLTKEFTSFVYTSKPVSKKSRILVEIVDSTNIKIIENNLPELRDEIIDASKKALSGLIANDTQKCSFTPQKYRIRFKVVREFGKGNYTKVY